MSKKWKKKQKGFNKLREELLEKLDLIHSGLIATDKTPEELIGIFDDLRITVESLWFNGIKWQHKNKLLTKKELPYNFEDYAKEIEKQLEKIKNTITSEVYKKIAELVTSYLEEVKQILKK